jgi:hypothetical protein
MRGTFVPWTALRGIGNSPIVRMAAVMPFVGYLIIFNETIVDWLKLSARFFQGSPSIAQDNPVIPKLYYVYFGLFFTGVGSLLYQLRCDPRLKKYATSEDYVNGVRDSVTDKDLHRYQDFSEEHGDASAATTDFVPAMLKDAEQAERIKIVILNSHYAALNKYRPVSRFLVATSYCLGLALLATPALHTFVSVLRSFFNRAHLGLF